MAKAWVFKSRRADSTTNQAALLKFLLKEIGEVEIIYTPVAGHGVAAIAFVTVQFYFL